MIREWKLPDTWLSMMSYPSLHFGNDVTINPNDYKENKAYEEFCKQTLTMLGIRY